MRRFPHNSGFALLMVLAVIFIAGTVLAACARNSCERVMEAGSALRRLQVRWGARSVRAVVLPAAEHLLAEQAEIDQAPAVMVSRRVTLGGVVFHAVVCDEQAKANVNLLHQRHGQANLAGALRSLQGRQRNFLPIRLRPGTYAAAGITGFPMRYASLDQVFRFKHPRQLIAPQSGDPPTAGNVTCWGSGKVNFKRAEVAVMRRVLAGVLTETQLARLREVRTESPDCTLYEAIGRLDVKKDKQRVLESLLTDASHCHALWLVVEGRTRNFYRLYVRQAGDAANDSQQWTFEW